MLTAAQNTVLRTAINADPAFSSLPNGSDEAFAIAAAFNLPASPQFVVWRSTVNTEEIWVGLNWTTFIGRSAGEREAFTLLMRNGVVHPDQPNVRQAFADIFSGVSGAAQRTALSDLSKRDATRAEALFAVGTGSVAVPATMTFEGSLSYADVLAARTV